MAFVQFLYDVSEQASFPAAQRRPQYEHDPQVQSQSREELFFQGHRLLLLEWNRFRDRQPTPPTLQAMPPPSTPQAGTRQPAAPPLPTSAPPTALRAWFSPPQSSYLVTCRIASYKAALLLRIPNLGCPTFIRDIPRRVVQAEGEPLLRRGTLPSQTSDKRREWPGCVLDLSKVTFEFD
jgi:hypothetical protein